MKTQWTTHEAGEGLVMILAIREDGLAEAMTVKPDVDVWQFRTIIKNMSRRLEG